MENSFKNLLEEQQRKDDDKDNNYLDHSPLSPINTGSDCNCTAHITKPWPTSCDVEMELFRTSV